MSFIETAPTLAVPLRFLVGVVAGIVATLSMDLVMARLPEGTTPPSIASGVLTRTSPSDAPARLGTVVHYLAGFLTGPLFVWLLFASEWLLGSRSLTAALLAAAVLYVLMVGFFALVVLPRSMVANDRVGTIRRDWALSALAYVVVLVPIVVVVSGLL
jgi:hypothetical protein